MVDSLIFGGVEGVVLTLLRVLPRDDWELVLVHHPSPALRPLVDGARLAGARTVAVPTMRPGWEGLGRLPAFVRTLRALRPDLVHVHLSWPLGCQYQLLAARLAGCKVVASIHLNVDLRLTRRENLQQRAVTRLVHRYLAVSEGVRRAVVERLGWPMDKIHVVPNGVDAGPSAPLDAELRASLAGPNDHPVVLVAARLHEQKGHAHLLRAMVEVPGAVLVVAGDGPERTSLVELACHLGIADRTRFLGHRHDVPSLLLAADLVVLPSLYEGLPLVLLEAMAAGRAVVVTRIPGVDEVVSDGVDAVVVDPADAEQLACAVRQLLADKTRRARLGAAARATVEQRFTVTAMGGEVAASYKRVLGGPSGDAVGLRRADWRFLLGTSTVGRAGCAGGRDLLAATGLVAREVVDFDNASRAGGLDSASGAGGLDLVTLSDPSAGQLKKAAALLRPGGACYVERSRPLLGGSRRARRLLARAGLEAGGRWWVWPPRRQAPAQLLVPLEGRGPTRHMRRRPLRPAYLTARVASGARTLTWDLARGTGLLAPTCELGWSPAPTEPGAGDTGPEPRAPQAPQAPLEQQLRAGWASWGLGPPPPRVDSLVLTGGKSDRNKVVVLAFDGDDVGDQPRAVVKLARVPLSAAGLRREGQVLRLVEASVRPPAFQVPRVLGEGELCGVAALVESPVAGTPLTATLTVEGFARLAEEVVAALAAAVPKEATSPDLWYERLVAPVLTDARARFPEVDPADIEDTGAAVRALGPLPLVVEHRDCSPWNVLRTPWSGLGLLDWESAEPAGLPLLDAAYFLHHAVLLLEGALGGGREPQAYAAHRDAVTGPGAMAREALERYARDVRLPAGSLPALRRFAWILHACVEQERRDEWSGEHVKRSPYLGLWRADTRLRN